MKNKFQLDVIGIGSPKCGTTWLEAQLAAHPELDFCTYKEPNHFLSKQFIKKFFQGRSSMHHMVDAQEFQACFANDGRSRGEYSVFYLYDTTSLQAIKKHNPSIKIILALRNPVEAAYSNYSYNKASISKDISAEDFMSNLDENSEYTLLYNYSPHVTQLLDMFSREQIHFVLFDEIKSQPQQVMHAVYEFIGVDANFTPDDVGKTIHPTKQVRSVFIARIAKRIGVLLADLGVKKIQVIAYRWYDRLNKSPLAKQTLSDKQQRQAYSFFAQDIKTLENITGLDLESWRVID